MGSGGEARARPTLEGLSDVCSLRRNIFLPSFICLDLGCHFLNGHGVLKLSSGSLWV